jgi:hypothetical protein
VYSTYSNISTHIILYYITPLYTICFYPQDMSDEESLPSLSSASAHRRKKRAGAGLTTEEEEDDLASSLYP